MYRAENLQDEFSHVLDTFKIAFAADFKRWAQKNVNLEFKYEKMAKWI